MKKHSGQDLSWEMSDSVVELALHREPLNEIGSLMLRELEEFIAQSAAIVPGRTRTQSEHHQEDQEHNAAEAEAARTVAVPLRVKVLGQLDQAPQDDQHRPVAGEQIAQVSPAQVAKVAQQEQHAKNDQDNGPGD